MSSRPWNRARALVLLAVLALLATACSGSASTTITDVAFDSADTSAEEDDAPEPTQAPEPTAEAAPEATAAPEPTPAPTAEPTPEPVAFWGTDLEPGMCIDRAEGNPPFIAPDVVDCSGLHQQEIYGKASLDFGPDEPYPGEDTMVDLVAEFCDPLTVNFGGETWDLLPSSPLLGYPIEEEWVAGDRNGFCFAVPVEGVDQKIGTAAGGSIDSDDVLIARAGLASDGVDFDDWVVLTEHANIETMGTLTDGQFDLPLRRPAVTERGLIFSAFEGTEGAADRLYGYDWEDSLITDFGNFNDDSVFGAVELTSVGEIVLAARENPDADWDIWKADGDSFAPLAAGDGDQRYPTLTPDGTQVVYHDRGDLWIIDLDGSNARQVTSSDSNDWESIVSPDGSTVVFASDRSGDDDLWSVSIDGGEPVNLTNHPADESWPTFNADGSLIYFSSDRLDPVDDRSRIMVMNPDGSNQSYFANVNASQATVAPAEVAQGLLQAPTLDLRYNYEQLVGDAGTTVAWEHSSGRLAMQAPAGWYVGEINEQTGFLVAEQPNEFFETWASDGAMVLLWEDLAEADFFALVDETEAALGCDQFDGSDGVQQLENGVLLLAANHDCGEGTVGGVLAFYNPATQVGVTIEGQTDGVPSRDEDNTMITAIAQSLVWE